MPRGEGNMSPVMSRANGLLWCVRECVCVCDGFEACSTLGLKSNMSTLCMWISFGMSSVTLSPSMEMQLTRKRSVFIRSQQALNDWNGSFPGQLIPRGSPALHALPIASKLVHAHDILLFYCLCNKYRNCFVSFLLDKFDGENNASARSCYTQLGWAKNHLKWSLASIYGHDQNRRWSPKWISARKCDYKPH